MVVDEKLLKRQYRLSQYCCSLLFGAVEEPAKYGPRIGLEYYSPPHYEGAHNWKLSVLDNPEDPNHLLINFCPFCGQSISIP